MTSIKKSKGEFCVTYTNRDIIEKIELLDKKNREDHAEIIKAVSFTNGKVKMHTKALMVIGTIFVGLFVWLLQQKLSSP